MCALRFNRVRYTIEAVLPAPAAASKAADTSGAAGVSGRAREGTSSAGALGVSIEKVTRVEGELLTRREALRGFEREYRQVQNHKSGTGLILCSALCLLSRCSSRMQGDWWQAVKGEMAIRPVHSSRVAEVS